jgi:hypothetical protein
MADFVMMLGDFVFQEFEVPESMEGILTQSMMIHNYPGGSRTVDAMGPQRQPFTISGYLMDDGAEVRRNQLETMAAAGLPVMMNYATRLLEVVIRKCTTKFMRFWEISYVLELEVVQDLSQPLPTIPTDFESAVENDVQDCTLDVLALADPVMLDAMNLMNGSILGPISLALATVGELTQMAVSTANAVQTAIARQTLLDSKFGSAVASGGFSAGLDAGTLIDSAFALSTLADQMPLIAGVVGFTGRIAQNIQAIQE